MWCMPSSFKQRLITFTYQLHDDDSGQTRHFEKQAVVRPRRKKPALNANDLISYWPISNLCFVSKVIERVIVAKLTAHIESQRLFACCQSAY